MNRSTAAFVSLGLSLIACATGTDATPPADDVPAVALDDSGSVLLPGDAGGSRDSDAATPETCVGANDAGCQTSNPGACAAGTMGCKNGVASCVSVATTQPCYAGPAATRGKGACRDGVQSCIGALGACAGEVLPAAKENCFNTVDDDCDGIVNNGCPDRVTVGADRTLSTHGGSGGSFTPAAHCPANSFVLRVEWYFDSDTRHLSGVGLHCATAALAQGAGTYSVNVTPLASVVKVIGNNPATVQRDDNCAGAPFNAAKWFVGSAGSFVFGAGLGCATGAATLAADNKLTFAFTEFGSGGYTSYPGGTEFDDHCAANEVLVGFHMKKGDYLDQIQGVCAPLVTVYK